MTNWRTMVGALCIVLAMVLGAFAGFVYARDAGVVGAFPTAGTRGEDRRLMSAFDEGEALLTSDEAEQVAAAEPQTALMNAESVIETATPDGTITVKPVNPEEDMRSPLAHSVVAENDAGTITVQQDPVGTRTHFVGGEIDAGGPYGGVDMNEGGPALTFTATANDPTIIFYRWDLNNDGVFDFPDQTGGGNMGKWTTSNTLTKQFFDDYLGDIVVQGWDGVSTTVEIKTGDNLNQNTAIQFIIGFGTFVFAARFTAKVNMQATQLGHYHYVFPLFQSGIWSAGSPGTLLGQCTSTHVNLQWNWCTLATPVSLVAGQEYLVGYRTQSYGNLILASNTPASPQVTWMGLYYCFSTTLCYPSTFFSATYQLMADFRWTQTVVKPDAAKDTAVLQINNVAPIVTGVGTTPSPALEGSPADFTAFFSDPGTDDTWEYRWKFHDGEVTPWQKVSKFNGGAKVLLFHTYGPNDGPILITAISAQCGNFCTKFDNLDFGPTGQNRVPSLNEIKGYDVLVVGTNFFFGHSVGIGDLLANYMDIGGAVVIAQGGLDNAFGCSAGICGRWDEDKYSPIPRGFIFGPGGSMGTIYVPGHPLLDGVSSIGTTGLAANIFTTNPGATRIVDWNNGRVLGATNTNPIVDNGARSVALNFFPILGFTQGNWARMMANAIRWASQQPDPTVKPMPIQLDPLTKIYKDDHPTTLTPVDTFQATVEVKDDDHAPPGSLFFADNMESGANGWTATDLWHQTSFRSNSPVTSWAFNAESNHRYLGFHSGLLTMPGSVSPGGADGLRLRFAAYQQTENGGGEGNFFDQRSVQVRRDAGSPWVTLPWTAPNTLAKSYIKWFTYDFNLNAYATATALQVRFSFNTQDSLFNNFEGWYIDDVFIGVPDPPRIQNGLGSGTGDAMVANVPPTAIGGFDSALRNEAQTLKFQGFEISDPAILEPTEWFAYAWDFDDGSAVDWRFVGSLAPPKFDILVIHTICLGLIDSTCPDLDVLVTTLKAQDDVGIVKTHNYINFPALPTAPTLNEMLQYDLIIIATNWAYFSFAPFDLARRQVGDRAAAYIDAGRGGVFTFMCVYCLSGGNDLFSIRGRYIDDDYGAFERTNYLFPGTTGLGTIYKPEHDIFVKVDPANVNSAFIHDGKMPLTTGGKGAAAGVAGQLLADWKDATSAIGIKELNNGMRTSHFGAFGRPAGSSTGMLIRNFVGWTAGGIPSPKIQAFDYVYGDNGIYTVDFMAIDDDMGFVWDVATNMPVQVLPDSALSHRFVEVSVDNVDPTIQEGSIEAFIAAEFCVRVKGTPGNTVTLNVWTDGALTATVVVTRVNEPPRDDDEDDDGADGIGPDGGGVGPQDDDDDGRPTVKCGLVKVDVLAPHSYAAQLTYTAPEGGSNPTWLIIDPWRDPVSPGHGRIKYKYDFRSGGPTSFDQALPTLKQDLLASGRGAVVDFAATAIDAGTDDLAFFWVWGTLDAVRFDDDGVGGIGPQDGGGGHTNPLTSVYTVHVHHNSGIPRTDGVVDSPHFLGFSEAYFDRGANTERTPVGTMGFQVRDTAFHAFDVFSGDWDDDGAGGIGPDDDDDDGGPAPNLVFYVVLIVLDDDNTRGYPSPFANDGVDMEFVFLDFR